MFLTLSLSVSQSLLTCSLSIGDTALFLQDSHSNFLALTVDGRIYYLNHASAESFKSDISSRSELHDTIMNDTCFPSSFVSIHSSCSFKKVSKLSYMYNKLSP